MHHFNNYNYLTILDGWVDGWMDGWMDGSIDQSINRSISAAIALRTISTHHNRVHQGSEVTNYYVIVHVGGNVGRIASGISTIISHFHAEGMVLGRKNVVH